MSAAPLDGYGQRPAVPTPATRAPAVVPRPVSVDPAVVAELRTQITPALEELRLDATLDAAARKAKARSVMVDAARRRTSELAHRGAPLPSAEEEHATVNLLFDDVFGLGPLQPLLDDPNVGQININGWDKTYVKLLDDRKVRGPAMAATNDELIARIQSWVRAAAAAGETTREFGSGRPIINVTLPDGSRLSAQMGVSPFPTVQIRKHLLTDVTLADLERLGTIDQPLREFLEAAMRAKLNIIVTGGQSAGKTTLVRALAAEIPPGERLCTMEKELELFLHEMPRHPDVLPLQEREANSDGAGAVSMEELFAQALRGDADRLIVGEVRHDEMFEMLTAMNSGHPGSLSTMHADRGHRVVSRMIVLATLGKRKIPADAAARLISDAVQLTVHVEKRRIGDRNQRVVTAVTEITGLGDHGLPATNELFVPGPDGLARLHGSSAYLAELRAAGWQDTRHYEQAMYRGVEAVR